MTNSKLIGQTYHLYFYTISVMCTLSYLHMVLITLYFSPSGIYRAYTYLYFGDGAISFDYISFLNFIAFFPNDSFSIRF